MSNDEPQDMKGTSRGFFSSEEVHRVLFEEAADGMFVTDPNGQLVAVNLRGINLVGYSREELLGIAAAELIPLEYPAQSPARLDGLREEWIETNERNIRRKDGGLIPVKISARRLSDGSLLRIVRNIPEHRQLEADLRESEACLRALIDNLPIEFWAMDMDLRYIMQNAVSLKNYGDVVGKRIEDLGLPPEVAAQWVEQDRKVLRGEILQEEYERDMEGEKRVFENLVAPVIVDEATVGIVGIGMDITARKRAEQALQKAHAELEQRVEERTADLARANRMLNLLSVCNQAVVRATEEPALLQEICRIIVDLGGYPLVWIGFAEQDAAQTVRPVAQAGFEDGYLDIVNITWADTGRGWGPTGTAIRSGQPCIARDIQTDPNFAPWREEAIRRGYASSIALPLWGDDRVFGALNIYAAVPDAFHAEGVHLFMGLADDLAYGIMSLRIRTEHEQADEALRASEERFRDLYENAPNAYFSIGVDGLIRRCNRRAGELLGYAVEELVGRPVMELYADTAHGKEKATQVLQRFQAGETVRDKELEMQKVDGNPVWVSLTVDAARDAEGRVVESRSMVVDITERRRVENIMQARLRLLEFANSHSADELLTATLDEIEALTGSAIGFYHFLEPDQRTLLLQNWSTNTLKNMCTAEGKGEHYDIAQAGVWVDCVYERRPVIHNDYASLPHRKGMPEGHAPVVREVVVPIFRGNLIKAIIGVGNKATDYNESDVEIVSQLGDLSWDITERKRAEEALKERHSTLRGIIDSANALIFSVDRQYRYTSFNQGHAAVMKALYGAEIETGHSLLDYMSVPEDRETAKGNLDRALAGEHLVEEAYSGEESRSRQYFQVSHSPIKSEAGQVIGVAVLAQDMTERKRTEETVRLMGLELQTIYDNTYTMFAHLDRDFNFIRVNQAYAEADKKHPDFFIGKNHFELYPHAENEAIFRRVVETGQPYIAYAKPFTYQDHPEWGVTYWDWTLMPVFSAERTVAGLVLTLLDVTERRRAEEALRQSEQRKTILNQIANVFLTIPDDEMYAEVLAVVLRVMKSKFGVFGFIETNGDLVIPSMTREIWDECQVPDKSIVFPQDAWGTSLWGRAIREKRAFYSDGPFHTPEGHIHIDHFLTVPIIFGNETIGLISVANNERGYAEEDKVLLESIADYISPILNARLQRDRQEQERERAERELQRSNDLLRAIIEAAPTAIIGLDLDGKVQTVWNPAAERMLGWSAQEVMGRFLPSVPVESQEEFRRFREWIRSGKTLDGVEVRRQRRDGSPIDYSIYASPLRDAESRIIGNIAVLVDITERKQAEEDLHKLSHAIEQSPVSIIITDTAGNIEYVNPKFAQVTGYTRDEAIGKNPRILKSGETPLEEYRRLWDTITHGGVWRGEFHNKKKNGELYWESASISPVIDSQGNIKHFVAVKEDITERVQAEEELKKHRDHLEELVRERTAELTVARDAAEKARQLAEAASQAKSVFLSSTSHELRTPLNAILGYVQILQLRPLDPDVINMLNIVQRSGEHLLTLINDILDIARIEAGKLELHPVPLHFPNFLDHIASIVCARAEAKGLTFSFEVIDTLPTWVEADETRLRQVLLNLLDNAVKFTNEGQVTLRVGSKEYEVRSKGEKQPSEPLLLTPYSLLRFEVQDTGISIAPDQIERIFQPFEQARGVTHWMGGAGLGLAISRQLVRLMGGDIQVQSEPGEGSTFWFEVALPVTKVAVEAAQPPERVITGYKGPRQVVLVADDVPCNRAMMVDLLASLGFEVIEAADGQQAIHLAQELRPDVILMDRWMPVLDGFEAARQIRRNPELEGVVVIAVSASVSGEDQVQSREAGVDAFLPKPIHWPGLAALLEEHLGLEWEYEEEIEMGNREREGEESRAGLMLPPEEMAVLLHLARRGDMRGIQERTAHIETLGEQYVPFAKKLRELAKAFEERQILALIECCVEKK